jgi:hypothetical protein
LSHNTEAGPRDSVIKAKACVVAEAPLMRMKRRWQSKPCPAQPMADDRRRLPAEAPLSGDMKFRATCSSSEREMWRVDEI